MKYWMSGHGRKPVFMFFFLVVCGLVESLAATKEHVDSESRIKKMFDEWRASADEIVFYGRVVDQYNQPVESAVVNVNAPVPVGYLQDRPRKCQVQADAQGQFEVSKKSFDLSALKGSFLFIDGIEKDGYEYVRGTDPHLGFSYRKGHADRHVPDLKNPIVFHMRKKGEFPTFLIEERYLELRVDLGDSGKSIGCDFVHRDRVKDLECTMGVANFIYDLKLKAISNTNNMTWVVTLLPGTTNGGIIASEQLLYEAPRDGYNSEWEFIPEDHKTPKMKYLYLRGHDPAIYTRLEIKYINANKEFFRLSGKSVTNPYGDRNLEQATDLPYEVTKQLTDEVKTAFRQNKRPPKPDLPKLIKDAKERAEKNKGKQP